VKEIRRATKPSWTQAYRLGVSLNREIEHACTLDCLGAELGITRQNAYTESVLALGKLAWALRSRFRAAHQQGGI